MLSLSQLDRNVVARFPLDDGLQFLQDRLRVVESRDESASSGQSAVSLLLTALMGQKAAYHLSSKTCSGNLAGELLKVLNRVQTEPFIYDRFRTLSLLVISRRSDVDIWTAVFNLISTFSHVTPPPSAPASFDETPVIRSSSSFQGSEQTRKILDPALFYEIEHCTYRNVEGFFEKYFENKSWHGKSQEILRSIKRKKRQKKKKWYHVGRWTGISDRPSEDRMWQWLSCFQAEFLYDSSGVFCVARNTKELSGGETKRQLDVIMKKRTEEEVYDKEKHNWKDVCVIGELKQSENDFKPVLLQLSRYARDVFTAQPTRRFLHAFTMQGRAMELWVFDRSGPYSSGEFDIHKEPEKLIKVITGYASMTDAELGLDTYTELKGTDRFIDVSADTHTKRSKLQLERSPFVKQRAIVCRGTTCFRTIDQKAVVKFSWTSDKRQRESQLLRLAHEKGVEGVTEFIGYEQLTTIDDLRSGMTFPPCHRFRTTVGSVSSSFSVSRSFGAFRKLSVSTTKRKHNGDDRANTKRSRSNSQPSKLHQQSRASNHSVHTDTSLYETDSSVYSNRIFGCLAISPAGRALRGFSSVKELLTALRDAIKGHRSLYMDGGILHRDISENNIIITDPTTTKGFSGILIDLDLAKIIGSGPSGARHQTGTVEFMAIQVLQKAAHTYRHDLESFFYVLLWLCARRAWELEFQCKSSKRPQQNVLKRWYTGTFEEIAQVKRGYMHVDGLEDILREFPESLDSVKDLCRRLRKILFPLHQGGGLDTGTHTGAEQLYSKIIDAYNETLGELDVRIDS